MITEALTQLAQKWWTFLLRGIVALVVAGLVFWQPASTAGALVYLFAAYFIISGIATMIAGFSFNVKTWWVLLLSGAVSVLLGFVMLSQPGAGPLALAYIFAIWMIMSGTTELSAAITLRSALPGDFWWGLLGVITLAVGFYVIFNPALGIAALVYTVAFYAVFAGISLIGFAFRLKGLTEPQVSGHAPA